MAPSPKGKRYEQVENCIDIPGWFAENAAMAQTEWAGLFDMDGVVVDTVPLHFRAWKRMFEEHGKPFTFEDYKTKVDGIPRRDGARAILSELSDTDLDRACEIKQGYFLEILDREKIPVYESTVRLVKDIRASGRKVALISSSKNLPRIVTSAGVADLWDTVIGGNDFTRGKPDPQVFLMAAERLNIPPGRCVGIDRHGDPGRLAKADIIVKDLAEVDLARVEKLFRPV